MIVFSFLVFVFFFNVSLVIFLMVSSLKIKFILFILKSCWYCLMRVFLGFCKIFIIVFKLMLFSVFKIGKWLISLGISL